MWGSATRTGHPARAPLPASDEIDRANWADLIDWSFTQSADSPLYEQVARLLQERILAGVISAGSRLPSTRQLMQRLGVSRTTVISAYEQLQADGYVVCKVGSGTYVADGVREMVGDDAPQSEAAQIASDTGRQLGLSDRGKRYQEMALDMLVLPNVPFNTGIARIDGRTAGQWQHLVRQYVAIDSMSQGYAHPQGSEALRQEITRYVAASRGVRCTPEQVIVVAGSQQAIDLTIKVLLDPGAQAWVEDPGYPPTRLSLATAGIQMHPIPIDEHGLDVDHAIRVGPDARAVFVTPSHQYPLGLTLSIERRIQLLEWARQRHAWVVEDDYDSEFRYDSAALPALQGLDRHQRVVYIGTFSKVLQPGLRYGYMVVPEALVKAFSVARFLADRHSPLFLESVLTEFIAHGYFVSHIRRMRTEYGLGRDVLVRLLKARLGHLLDVVKPNQGLHLIAYLRGRLPDTLVAEEAGKVGVVVRPISRLYADPSSARSGLMLGFAGITEARMVTAVERLAAVVERLYRDFHPA